MKSGTVERRRRIGARIRAARVAAELSQIELAQKLSVSNSIISSWETGRASISADDLAVIAQALDKPFGYFGGDSPSRKLLDQFEPDELASYLTSRLRPKRPDDKPTDSPNGYVNCAQKTDYGKQHNRRTLTPQRELVPA